MGPPRIDPALSDAPGGQAFEVQTEDGLRLRLGLWHEKGRRGTILLFPGRTEYIEKYGPVLDDLAARDYATLIIDWRGQGASERLLPDPRLGHIDDFAAYQRDITAMTDLARRLDLPRPWFLLGHSMGGAIGLRALLNGLPVQAAAFSAPMWRIWLAPKPEWAVRALAELGCRIGLGGRIALGQSPDTLPLITEAADNPLTSDPDSFARLRRHAETAPDLVLGGPSFGWVRAALAECAALARLPAPDLPCVTGLGSDEEIVSPEAIRARMSRWPGGKLDLYPGARHELMMERPAHRTRFLDAADALFRQSGA